MKRNAEQNRRPLDCLSALFSKFAEIRESNSNSDSNGATLGSGLISLLLSAAVNPLAGRLLENAYWFYTYRYTITPVLLIVPVFALLGYAIPAVMYRQAAKQSVVERLREAEA